MDAGNSQNSYITKEELQFFESSLKEEREVLRGRRKDSAKLLKEYSDAEEVNETLIMSQDAEKKIKEINGALERIKNGTYGYCQKTGEEIGVKRLKIEPTAKFCIEAQEEMEKNADLEEDE